jgi:hypothetical protein
LPKNIFIRRFSPFRCVSTVLNAEKRFKTAFQRFKVFQIILKLCQAWSRDIQGKVTVNVKNGQPTVFFYLLVLFNTSLICKNFGPQPSRMGLKINNNNSDR